MLECASLFDECAGSGQVAGSAAELLKDETNLAALASSRNSDRPLRRL